MLNEGYALYKSLERCGIQLINRHPDVKEPGKKEGLIVGLDKKGRVSRIEYRNAKEISNLWTTRVGMHNSFPVLTLQHPLWEIGQNDPLRKKLNHLRGDQVEKRKILDHQSHKISIISAEKNWWKRLQERVTFLHPFFKTTNTEYSALNELTSRFLLAKSVDDFAEGLLNELKKNQNDIPYTLYEVLLIGNKLKHGKYRAEVPLVLDLSDWEKYSVRIASPKMEPFVNESLFKMQSNDSKVNQNADNEASASALSGKKVCLEDDKFPSPKLPQIGITYLFAVNDQTPCQTRYTKTSIDIFPVGRQEANIIQDSFNWITDAGRKGKTWYPVPGLNDRESDLLIVYLEDKPDINVNKAHLLGGMSKNDFSESTYEAISSVAIKSLRGENIVNANSQIRLFALSKADPGRTQISLQRVYTISDLLEADTTWQEAAKNSPNISLPFFRKEIEKAIADKNNVTGSISKFLTAKEEKAIFLPPYCPFPADLVRLTQKQWIRFGQDFSSVSGYSLGDIYDIFFSRQNENIQLSENLLAMTLQRTQPLLIGLGHADHKKEMNKFNAQARFTTLTTISAFAIYLYKLGIKKEVYMKDTFFYIGRFLSLIDSLHLEYCKNVRGGNIPPQLLGNAHLQIALDNPTSAIDMLSRRIGIYQAWTRKEQGDEVKLARWVVGQLGSVTELLAGKNLPNSTSSLERAQILLGYLARPEKKAETDLESTKEIIINK